MSAPTVKILIGDALEKLKELPDKSVHCVVTSPPYFHQRDYSKCQCGGAGPNCPICKGTGIIDGMKDHQVGLEKSPEEYVQKLVEVFRDVKRVLRDDGTLWIVIGDSYATVSGGMEQLKRLGTSTPQYGAISYAEGYVGVSQDGKQGNDLKHKDLCMIPSRVATALQEPYYTGKIKNAEDRRWLAGMVDGEGCIFISRSKKGAITGRDGKYVRTQDAFDVGVKITNTHRELIDEVRKLVGWGSVRVSRTRSLDAYEWATYSNNARDFIREVYPYLIAKQYEARLALGCPPSGDDAEKAHETIKVLHKGGKAEKDYPAPPSMYESGWYLRSDIIWSKPNPMPESVTDRPTKSHEYIFLLTKSSKYFYDQEAIREVYNYDGRRDTMMKGSKKYASSLFSDQTTQTVHERGHERWPSSGRNARSVWEIATEPYQDAHFAVFSRELPERCIKAGSSERGCCSKCGAPWERIVETERTFESGSGRAGHIPSGKSGPFLQGGGETIDIRRGPVTATTTTGWQPTCGCYTVQEVLSESGIVPCTVLDPFAGSGTTGEVARSLGRSSILIELNPQYEPMIRKRVLPEVKPFTEFGDEDEVC